KDGIVPGDLCPARDARPDRAVIANGGFRFDPAVEHGADDALVHEIVAGLELALGGKLRDPRGGSGAAGRAVDRLVAIEHGVAGIGARIARLVAPLNVGDAANAVIFRMHRRDLLLRGAADDWAQANEFAHRHAVESAPVFLRFDDGVVVAAVGHIDFDRAEAGHLDLYIFGMQ